MLDRAKTIPEFDKLSGELYSGSFFSMISMSVPFGPSLNFP